MLDFLFRRFLYVPGTTCFLLSPSPSYVVPTCADSLIQFRPGGRLEVAPSERADRKLMPTVNWPLCGNVSNAAKCSARCTSACRVPIVRSSDCKRIIKRNFFAFHDSTIDISKIRPFDNLALKQNYAIVI